MSLPDDLERLAALRERGALTETEFRQAKAKLLAPVRLLGTRRQSTYTFAGLPLWSIAVGPDPERGELRGHAKGVLAVGDLATGILAIGGVARGVVALGGVALGFFSVGGLAQGLLLALGGGAVGALAFGGGAAGVVAVGGGAIGHYAIGGQAAGNHVLSAERCDPEALAFFERHLGWAGHVVDRRTGEGRFLPGGCPQD